MFLGMPGAGAKLHADSVCEPIFSVQLSGRKRWRLSPLPPYRRAMRTQANLYIEGRQEGGWEPTYDFVLEPGEAVFFPTTWMHETRTLEGRCSLSLSLQWRYPFPVGFIRDFSPRLLRAKETHFCYEHWAPFITGDVDGIRRIALPVLRARGQSERRTAQRAMERQIQERFREMDEDGDGFVTASEKASHFAHVLRAETERGALVEFDTAFEAVDWIAFHDEPVAEAAPDAIFAGGDGDSRVSEREWVRNIGRMVEEYIDARTNGAVDVED